MQSTFVLKGCQLSTNMPLTNEWKLDGWGDLPSQKHLKLTITFKVVKFLIWIICISEIQNIIWFANV